MENDAYKPVNKKTLADLNRANAQDHAPCAESKDAEIRAFSDPDTGNFTATTYHEKLGNVSAPGKTKTEAISALKERIKSREHPEEKKPQDAFEESKHPRGKSGEFGAKHAAAKSKLESSGHKAVGTHKGTGATIYKHPKEKGSVLLTKEGDVIANE